MAAPSLTASDREAKGLEEQLAMSSLPQPTIAVTFHHGSIIPYV